MAYYSNKNVKLLRAVLIGVLVGVLLCTVFLAVTSFSFVKMGKIPIEAVGILTQVFAAFSAFASGFISVRIIKEHGMVVGLFSGFILFLITLIAGLFFTEQSVSFATLTKAFLMCISGSIGGIVAVNKKQRIR